MSVMNETAADAMFTEMMSADKGKWLVPRILGFGVDLFLLGIMLGQLYYWATNFRDKRFIRIIVHTTTTFAAGMSIHNIIWTVRSFAYDYGNYKTFNELQWDPSCHLLDMLSIVPVQLFYLERAYLVNQRAKWIPIVVGPIVLASACAGVGGMIIWGSMDTNTHYSVVKDNLTICFEAWIASTTAVDLLLTVLICVGLWRSRTGWNETDRVIVKLVKFSVETQLPGTIIAFVFLLTYGIKSMGFLTPFFVLLHPKTYAIALLAVLNYRNDLRSEMGGTQMSSGHRHLQDLSAAESGQNSSEAKIGDTDDDLFATSALSYAAATRG